MTHFWGKILVENFGEKMYHNNSGEILCKFVLFVLFSELNPI